MRELELDEPAGLDLLPVPLARPSAHLGRPAPRLRARRTRRSGPAAASPGTSSSSTRGSRRRIDGEWHEQNGIRHRIDHAKHDNRIDITLESGDAISLWWLNRSEWEGLIDVGRLRGRGALRRLRAAAVRRDRERVRLGCPQAVAPTTRSRGSTTRGARASPRTSSSTSRRRARPAARSSSSACGTGRISVPIAKAGIRVIGVDASAGMLEVAREYAAAEGVGALDLRLGDLREPPVDGARAARR